MRWTLFMLMFLAASGFVQALADNSEVAWQCLDEEYLIDLFTVGGRPVNNDPNHNVKILINHGYAVGYCEERRNPLWAVWGTSGITFLTDFTALLTLELL
jgi:hypothetical protein